MAELVSSAIIGETVSRIMSSLSGKDQEKSQGRENIERLEMAHIKMEAVLQISNKWQINHMPLVRWRRKLKRAAQECDDTLHRCKQRALEEDEISQEVSRSSFPKRIAYAAKSFTSYFVGSSSDESSNIPANVRRFERFADGASEFLRLIELGGTPYRHMPFGSLAIRHLFAGKALQYKEKDQGNEYPSFRLWLVPFCSAKHGIEACLSCVQKHSNSPENNFYFSLMLQLSESTDIVGIAIKCLGLFGPRFRSAVETIKKQLTHQIPTQDLSWVPFSGSRLSEHWGNLQSLGSQWFRPNPFCCKQHDQHELQHISNSDMDGLPGVSQEPVIQVSLYCQVSLSEYNKHRTSLVERKHSLKDFPNLEVGFFFTPHGSPEGLLSVYKSSATVVIDGKGIHCLNTDITLEQVKDIMLPRAIDYFHHNTEVEVYQLLWKSRHGTAYIQVERETMKSLGSWKTFGGGTKRKRSHRQVQKIKSPTNVVSQFFSLWVAHAPIHLQDSIVNWIKKQKGNLVGTATTTDEIAIM